METPPPFLTLGRTAFYTLTGIPGAGEIAQAPAEVIVSSAGTDVAMRAGVSEAIRLAGGDAIEEALKNHAPLTPGQVVITSAGRLRAKNVYHAVVVNWAGPKRVLQATLWRVVQRCIELAQLTGMTSLAFPSLGTHAGGAERHDTYSTMAAACLDALRPATALRKIYFCLYDTAIARLFQTAFLQQQLLRQTTGLLYDTPAEQATFTANLPDLFSTVLKVDANLEYLSRLVTEIEKRPTVQTVNKLSGVFHGPVNVGDIYAGSISGNTVSVGHGSSATTQPSPAETRLQDKDEV